MKNNRLLCCCYLNTETTDAIVVYRQLSPFASRLERRSIASVQYEVAAQRGFLYLCSLCYLRTKLATHCSRARKLAHFLKRLLIFSWPPMPLTNNAWTFNRHSRIRSWKSGVTDRKNAYRILGLFTKSAAAICSYCSAPQTSRITFNHCQP